MKKKTFSVENGHYEYARMSFKLKNAPATFMRVMDTVLKKLQARCYYIQPQLGAIHNSPQTSIPGTM